MGQVGRCTCALGHSFALQLLLVLRLAAAFTCSPPRDQVTCATLGDFYAALGGVQWSQVQGWQAAASGTGADYCAFAGVTCDANSSVTSMCEPPLQERGSGARLPP